MATRVVVVSRSDAAIVCRDMSGRSFELSFECDQHVIDDHHELLSTGTYEQDGDDRLFLSSGHAATLYEVRVKGGRSGPRFELQTAGSNADAVLLPIAELGVGSIDLAERIAASGLQWLAMSEDPADGMWHHERGLAGWGEAQVESEIRQRDAVDLKYFVNPYTFVPLPEGPCLREQPAGHDLLHEDRYMGALDIEIELLTPLLARGSDGVPRNGRGQLIVPGSGLKGALRSLHETMFGGCLRVLDLDFVPSYRDTATNRSSAWKLGEAVVDATGRLTHVKVCDELVWARAGVLQTVLGDYTLRSGATFDITKISSGRGGRKEVTDPTALTPGSGWVVLVTDRGPRSTAGTEFWYALGRRTSRQVRVTDEAWLSYLAAVDGADDLRTAAARTEEVRDEAGRLVGRRDLASRELRNDQVLWVDHEEGRAVSGIALAAIWRHMGAGSVERRIGDHRPCSDPASLCISCRLFGSTDDNADGRRAGPADQAGYRGHLRFTDAVVAAQDVEPEDLALPPLGRPRPGAGQFYLKNTSTAPGQRPTREWGSGADLPTPRAIRGRKLYWHGDPARNHGRPRHQARSLPRPEAGEAEVAHAAIIPANQTKLATRVWFENLTAGELGSLLAVLQPELVLADHVRPDAELAWRLGGGKPLGLGSVRLSGPPRFLELHNRRCRAESDVPCPQPAIDKLLEAARESAPDQVRATWPDLAALLDRDHVDPRLIWYPPGARWDQFDGEDFDQGFEFWKQTSGQFMTNTAPRPLQTLPDPRDPWQYLPIIEKS